MIRAIRSTYARRRVVVVLIWALLVSERRAYAQLDPLLYLKTQTPNITLVVDTTSRMQRDADEAYYDPNQYTKTGAAWEPTIGVNATTTATKYYRKFVNLAPPLSLLGIPLDGLLYKADRIETVGDLQPGFGTFLERTRIEVARRGVLEAIDGNMYTARFNLLRLGQVAGASNFQTTQRVYVSSSSQNPPSAVEVPGTSLLGIPLTAPGWKITRNTNLATGASVASLLGAAIPSEAIGGNTLIRDQIVTGTGTTGALVPLGLGDLTQALIPVSTLLQGTLAEVIRWLTGGPVCQNTAIVMVVGGGEPLSITTILLFVTQLLALIFGHRVPVHVVAIAPPAGDVAFLQNLSDMTGGKFTHVTKAMIDVTVPGQPVAEVVNAINWAVQHALLPPSQFNQTASALSSAQLRALTVEQQSTSPITGSVNLKGRVDIAGNLLPNTEIFNAAGVLIPQRSNVLVSSGYTLPGMDGKLRAFRVYKPIADVGRPGGYKFSQDGTRLWVASPPGAGSRNIFTVLPNGTMTPFTTGNASTLAPYLGAVNAADLIQRIRSQPIGAVVGSTPAIMDPPSLDPPPDPDYAFFKDLNRNRRSIIFVGANDGMLHAIDGRTGLELWAFIPFNLLPKLRTLPWGHGLDAGFRAMVDSSPKLSDVKVNGQWRTYLFFGESGGGTFYNAIDVTLHRMDQSVLPDNDAPSALLSYFAVETRVPWVWSFPQLTSFDHTIAPYGDVSASASNVEKTVGESWSDPAVGRISDEDGEYGVFVGSGFLPYSKQQQTNRGGVVAGTTFYVLSAATGAVLANRSVGNDGSGETDNSCRAAGDCMRSKNALQMDPVATGPVSTRYVNKIYIGDLDGRVWRMSVARSPTGAVTLSTPTKLYDYSGAAAEPLYASMATVNVGLNDQYLFVGSGSDLLPTTGVNQEYSLRILLDTGDASADLKVRHVLERTNNSGNDEKFTGFPAVAGDIVFFTTTTHVVTTPCTPFNSSVYAFTFTGGPAYDTTGDGQIKTKGSGADTPKVYTRSNARATAPFIVDQHLAVGIGDKVEIFGDPQDFNSGVGQAGVRILSWREVR
jgi:hypothetical protein